jgi:DNA polymerase III alpha subunit
VRCITALSFGTDTPMVVTNDSHYPSEEQRKAHIAQLAAKKHRQTREVHEGESSGTTKQSFTPQYTQWLRTCNRWSRLPKKSLAPEG